ncbi:MAG TPA: FIST N-terminal domain-containing protein [Tepidisphaeraceae bacterium]|nr:FIST N-terminal domain-containing protein [Tepidisphaeraceae bacterium]
MRFYSAISGSDSAYDAVEEVIAEAEQAMEGKIDAVFAFFTAHHREDAEEILERLWLELDPQALVGCSAEGVIAGELEIEREPGIAILTARLPDVRIHPFHIASRTDWRHLLTDEEVLRERLGIGEQTRAILAFADPFTTPLDEFMPCLDEHAAGIPLLGGMASSARRPGENILLRNDQTLGEGMVGLSLSGPISVEAVVSQGCRPIGTPMVVTKSHDNVIEQIGGKPTLTALQNVIESLPESERDLLQNGLLVGRAISEYRDRFGRGDFLVRNVVGVDQDSGAVAMADYIRTGQTVQFHVRDAKTADEDLRMMLETQQTQGPAAGALLFSCNGRGTNLFEDPCHDIGVARKLMPQTPAAGFFAAGELGPVGGKNFVHGHTASMALFRANK